MSRRLYPRSAFTVRPGDLILVGGQETRVKSAVHVGHRITFTFEMLPGIYTGPITVSPGATIKVAVLS
jgi:hypothetical protein